MTEPTATTTETFDVKGGHLVEKIKDLLHEGNVRRLIIKDADHKTVVEVPVTVGVVGFIVAPTMAAIAALAALAADYSIDVEREVVDTTVAATPAAEKGAGHE
jgi:hypothetical protein